MGSPFRGGFGGGQPGFFRRLYWRVCSNIWCIFAAATFALFLYALVVPSIFIMIVLFFLVSGLILWLRN